MLITGAGPGPILRTKRNFAPADMTSLTEHLAQAATGVDIAAAGTDITAAGTDIAAAGTDIAAAGVDEAIESFLGPAAQAFSSIVFFELQIGARLPDFETKLPA